MSASTRALKKDTDLPEGGWKNELNSQILLFLDLLNDNIGTIGSGTSDLKTRLNTYRTRLKTDDTLRTSQPPPIEEEPKQPPPMEDGPSSTDVLRHLLQESEHAFSERCDQLRSRCTLEAAVDDTKVR